MNNTSTLKSIQLLYKALLMAQVLFLGVAIFVRSQNLVALVDEEFNRLFQIVVVVISFAGIWFGMWYYRKRVAIIRDMNVAAEERLKQYQAVSIIKWALTEGPCLLCAVGYLLTGNWAFLALAAVILFIFAGYNPQKSMVMRELGLAEDEL